MGSTIGSFLPQEYKHKFFGSMSLEQYEQRHNIVLNVNKKRHAYKNNISIDHIHVDELMQLGIIKKEEMHEYECIAIIREPIDRFISICNYEFKERNRSLEYSINNLRENNKQINCVRTKNPWKIKLVRMEDAQAIIDFFKKYDVHIDLDKKVNVSEKRFTIDDFTEEELEKIRNFYKDDIELYESITPSNV